MSSLAQWRGVFVIGAAYIVTAIVAPSVIPQVIARTRSYMYEMMAIIPAVVILMGLFEVWVPKEMIQRRLGQRSGYAGMVLAFAMGTAPTGPLYVAFPIASVLLGKGASVANVIVFMSAWAAAKIPQIAMEAKFLGLDFAAVRLILTALLAMVMGIVGQRLLKEPSAIAGEEVGHEQF